MDFTIPYLCLVSYRPPKTSKCYWIITRRPKEEMRRALFFNQIFNINSNVIIRSEESDLQSATKLVETLCPKGPLWGFANLKIKGENKAFPPPPPQHNIAPLFKLPVENNQHPNFNG